MMNGINKFIRYFHQSRPSNFTGFFREFFFNCKPRKKTCLGAKRSLSSFSTAQTEKKLVKKDWWKQLMDSLYACFHCALLFWQNPGSFSCSSLEFYYSSFFIKERMRHQKLSHPVVISELRRFLVPVWSGTKIQGKSGAKCKPVVPGGAPQDF